MVIENRNLTPGTRLVATYKKARHACIVTAGEDGKLAFTLDDGRSFKSPSAAGSALMGGMACNGWRFWSVEGEAPSASAEKPEEPTRPARPKGNGTYRVIKRVPNQRGVPEGEVRYFCDCCMASFTAPAGEAPTECPKGHGAAESNAAAGVA